jgi:hypothetical protein
VRLSEERPVPGAAFRARLDRRIHELASQARRAAPSNWRLWAVASLGSGLALLVITALVVVAG